MGLPMVLIGDLGLDLLKIKTKDLKLATPMVY
jgi:hypothetical protein